MEKNYRVRYQDFTNNTWCLARFKYQLKFKKLWLFLLVVSTKQISPARLVV